MWTYNLNYSRVFSLQLRYYHDSTKKSGLLTHLLNTPRQPPQKQNNEKNTPFSTSKSSRLDEGLSNRSYHDTTISLGIATFGRKALLTRTPKAYGSTTQAGTFWLGIHSIPKDPITERQMMSEGCIITSKTQGI